jgi:hypothetical protein
VVVAVPAEGLHGGRLLRTADWNADAVRDELRAFVVERLGPGGC